MIAIGKLVTEWAVCESLIWGLFSSLTETESGGTSAVLWLSFRNTSSRVNVVDRLAKSAELSEMLKTEVEEAVNNFNALSKVRNFFCHAWYAANTETLQLAAIESHRLSSNGVVVEREEFTEATVAKVTVAIQDAQKLCRSLWRVLHDLRDELQLPNGSFVLQHAGA